jgi:uncharacterized protein (TIGR02001 family)
MHRKPAFRFGLSIAWMTLAAPILTVGAVATPAISITASPTIVSDYMFRGLRLNGPAFQPAIEASAGNLTLGVWSNFPLKDKVRDSADPEIDPYGAYTFPITKELSLAPGFTWYNTPRAPRNAGLYRHTFEPSLAVNYTFTNLGLKLTPKLYYDTVREGPVYEFTAIYAFPLKDIGTELDVMGTVGTYKLDAFGDEVPSIRGPLPATKAWGDYWLLNVQLPFQIAANQKIMLGLTYTEGRHAFTKQGRASRAPNPLARSRGVVSLSYAFTF